MHFMQHSQKNLQDTSRDNYIDQYKRVEIWVLVTSGIPPLSVVYMPIFVNEYYFYIGIIFKLKSN